jgi:hypothetical protein
MSWSEHPANDRSRASRRQTWVCFGAFGGIADSRASSPAPPSGEHKFAYVLASAREGVTTAPRGALTCCTPGYVTSG